MTTNATLSFGACHYFRQLPSRSVASCNPFPISRQDTPKKETPHNHAQASLLQLNSALVHPPPKPKPRRFTLNLSSFRLLQRDLATCRVTNYVVVRRCFCCSRFPSVFPDPLPKNTNLSSPFFLSSPGCPTTNPHFFSLSNGNHIDQSIK